MSLGGSSSPAGTRQPRAVAEDGNRPLLLDLRGLGVNAKGVGRVLEGLTPRLIDLDPDRYHVVCTKAALPLLPAVSSDHVHLVPRVPQSTWEQLGLPALARRISASAVYSHSECGAWWGPPLLLHLTEDPEIRWSRNAPEGIRDNVRRNYSRIFMARALARARVCASTTVVADHLAFTYRLDRRSIDVIPLAVDHSLFRPTPRRYEVPFFFHLASGDPRDRTALVVEAYARFAHPVARPPHLVIGGGVGEAETEIRALAERLAVEHLVHLPGRLSDEDLVASYSSTVACVQPASDEGFGLQPLEALACGALLIATREPSVAEVVGDARALWTEASVPILADALSSAWTDLDLRADAQILNPRRAREFTWTRTAEIVHRRLTALGDPGTGDTDSSLGREQ